ncbi:helix-turn-helix domain-containing protein [Pseudomonas fluorescens]|nr:helix-turn-helix domain-containing protein [Pseudomonas fluorescens]
MKQELLTAEELSAMSARIGANADQWLTDNAPVFSINNERKPKANRGPKPGVLVNPFYRFIGCTTEAGRYPDFALDVIEGIARLDQHHRDEGVGGKSMPLSVRNIALILESLPVITNESVEDFLQLKESHARRYFKAVSMIVPRMMECRPSSLIDEMNGNEFASVEVDTGIQWDDMGDMCKPSAEDLAKLHYDLRTLTEYSTFEECEMYHQQPSANDATFEMQRTQHPKRQEVMSMLEQGLSRSEIERLTGVPRKTVRRWHNEPIAA